MTLLIIILLTYSSQCVSQLLLTTHFIAAKSLGFRTLEYGYLNIQHTTTDLTESKDNLKAHLPVIKQILAADKYKNQVLEPISFQRSTIEEHINSVISQINIIEALASKNIKRDKRDTDNVKRAVEQTCILTTQVNKTKIDTSIVGLGDLVLQAKVVIDAYEGTVTSFVGTDEYYLVSFYLTSSYMLLAEIKSELTKAQTRLTSLIQNEIDPFTRSELNTLYCLREKVELIQDIQLESCLQQNRQITCTIQLTLGKTPTLVYQLKPLHFDDCFVDRTFYMDGRTNVFSLNDRQILTTAAPDKCAQAILNSNVSSITTFCPLNKLKKIWEFGYKVLVFHSLNDQIVEGLRNNSIQVTKPPFTLREGTYKITLDHVEYHVAHSPNTLIEPSNLPFPRQHLCPPHAITSFFTTEYLAIHGPGYIFNSIILTIMVTMFMFIGKCIIKKCKPKRNLTPVIQRDQEVLRLLALAHRPSRVRR